MDKEKRLYTEIRALQRKLEEDHRRVTVLEVDNKALKRQKDRLYRLLHIALGMAYVKNSHDSLADLVEEVVAIHDEHAFGEDSLLRPHHYFDIGRARQD